MSKKLLVAIVLGVGVALLFAVSLRQARLRQKPEAAKQTRRPARMAETPSSTHPALEPAPFEAKQDPGQSLSDAEAAQAMDTGAVKGLVLDLKLAAARGDDAIRRGLVQGLRRHGRTSKQVLAEEIAATSDQAIIDALEAAMREMP